MAVALKVQMTARREPMTRSPWLSKLAWHRENAEFRLNRGPGPGLGRVSRIGGGVVAVRCSHALCTLLYRQRFYLSCTCIGASNSPSCPKHFWSWGSEHIYVCELYYSYSVTSTVHVCWYEYSQLYPVHVRQYEYQNICYIAVTWW